MITSTRKAKVTEESLAESKKLREIWDSRPHSGQAEFGEVFSIGTQSAVGQYLRGELPLNLKAAAGFAKGLNCTIADFSLRLADQATQYAELSGFDRDTADLTQLARNEMQLVLLYRKLSEVDQTAVLGYMIYQANNVERPLESETASLDARTIQHFRSIAAREMATSQLQRIQNTAIPKLVGN